MLINWLYLILICESKCSAKVNLSICIKQIWVTGRASLHDDGAVFLTALLHKKAQLLFRAISQMLVKMCLTLSLFH